MNEQNAHTQLNVLREFEFSKTPVLAGIAHMGEAIALKHVCENLGLDWNGQYQRINRDSQFSQLCVQMEAVGKDGKNREMVCLKPMDFQNWLFWVSESTSDNLNRSLLAEYQKGLVIYLLMMLKVSLDEVVRLSKVEQQYIELKNHLKDYFGKDDTIREFDTRKKNTKKEKQDLQATIIKSISGRSDQLSLY